MLKKRKRLAGENQGILATLDETSPFPFQMMIEVPEKHEHTSAL